MKFQVSAFGHAVSDFLGETATAQWHAGVCALPGSPRDEVTADEAGTAVAAALSAITDPSLAVSVVESLYLKSVMVGGSTSPVVLSSGDALAHLLLRDWLGGSAGEAVGKVLAAGATHQQLALGAPFFESFEVRNYHQLGQVGARLDMTFQQPHQTLQVSAYFGAFVENPSLCCTNRISGDALVSIGRTAHATRAVVAAAQDAATAPPSTAGGPPPGASIN